jgi:hypothetical protein
MSEPKSYRRILHRCNTIAEIERGYREFDGAELDVRLAMFDDVELVAVTHDKARHGDHPVTLRAVLRMIEQERYRDPELYVGKTLFVNVKEHGMAPKLATLLSHFDPPYYLFDVPGVETREYEQLGLKVLGRFSPYEVQMTLTGTLVDAFGMDQQPLVDDAALERNGRRPIALISNLCHGVARPNYTKFISHLIGKESELA